MLAGEFPMLAGEFWVLKSTGLKIAKAGHLWRDESARRSLHVSQMSPLFPPVDASALESNEEIEIAYPITCGDSKAILLWKKFVCPGINVKCVKVNSTVKVTLPARFSLQCLYFIPARKRHPSPCHKDLDTTFNDQLISPKHFVHLAGKSTLKDWKRAIRLGGIMLR
ncbi:Glucocorticoid modulatory element-binding protein 1, partial [Ophiophagus hannah]